MVEIINETITYSYDRVVRNNLSTIVTQAVHIMIVLNIFFHIASIFVFF